MNADAATLWPRVAEGLRRDLGARTFDHWLKPVRFAEYCTLSGVVTLETLAAQISRMQQTIDDLREEVRALKNPSPLDKKGPGL